MIITPVGRGSRDAGTATRLPRIGVIGFGYWGPNVVRNLRDTGKAELVAVAETRRERHANISLLAPGVEVLDDHRRLLESDVDGIVVATPIHTHFEIACEALRAGKHVLVEKPLTASADEAAQLIELASSLSLTLMVGHTFIYNPAIEELARIVRSGDLGRIYHVDTARLNLGQFQRRSNVIWDLAPHDIAILLYLFGRTPVVVSSRGSTCLESDVHDVAYVEVIFDDGLAAQIHVSWLDPAKVRRVTLLGDRKMAVFNDVSAVEKLRIYDHGITLTPDGPAPVYRLGSVTIPAIAWREPLLVQCEHFAECISTGAPPITDGVQGMAVVATLEAANRSLAMGGERVPVRMPEAVMVAGGERISGQEKVASPLF